MSFSTIFQSYRDEANTSWLILGISQYSGELMCLAFRTQHGAPKRGYNVIIVIPPGHSAPSKTLSQDNIVALFKKHNQRTIGPENAHLKPDPAVLSHHEMTLTLNTHTPLLNS